LGSSKFQVYVVHPEHNPNQKLVMKIFNNTQIPDTDTEACYLREKDAYTNLRHPNILQMEDAIVACRKRSYNGQFVNVYAIVLEYAEKKDLFEYVVKTEPFSEDMSRMIFKQLLDAVEYIHAHGYVHLDLKIDNAFVDKNFVVKIADFDLTRPNSNLLYGRVGSCPYMAPEVGMTPHVGYDGEKVDIFALGVMLFILCVGFVPFEKADERDKGYSLYVKSSELFWESWENEGVVLSTPLKRLLTGCFALNPSERPTMEQIRNSEWMNMERDDPVLYRRVVAEKFSHMV